MHRPVGLPSPLTQSDRPHFGVHGPIQTDHFKLFWTPKWVGAGDALSACAFSVFLTSEHRLEQLCLPLIKSLTSTLAETFFVKRSIFLQQLCL
jgi:hypothetical protein